MTNTMLTLLSAERLEEHYRDGHWGDETIYMLANAHAERAPDRIAVRDRARGVSYAELLVAADALADDLAARGLRPGQRVSVWLPSRVETLAAMLACSRNGYVCCPSLHRDHTVGDILTLIERNGSAALIAQEGYGADAKAKDVFAPALDLPAMRHVYRLGPTSGGIFAGLLGRKAAPTKMNTDPNRVVYLAFTSGTTGTPKGVMHSDNTLLSNARQLARDWHLNETSAIYTLSPLSHNLGLGAMVMALAIGAELIVHDLPRGASLLDRIVETNTNFLVGVPTHAIDLLAELRAKSGAGLTSLKGFRISGASIPGDIAAELLSYGVIPQSGYGMTESCSHQYTLPTDDAGRITETSGKACAGYEVRIWKQDDPDTEAPVGEIGQIGGRGASLMLGYFDDQTRTEESFNKHGWFMTGDLGQLDENGYLRVTGRKKDLIIRGGHNIYPAHIESYAAKHKALKHVAAFPVPDARLGEKVCLAVVFNPGESASPEEIFDLMADAGLSRYDMPEYFIALDALPRTPSGKNLKAELASGAASGELKVQPIKWRPKTGT
jgi:acyl-CoA synthetase (AMP-forming)/AMP-acid ligase II